MLLQSCGGLRPQHERAAAAESSWHLWSKRCACWRQAVVSPYVSAAWEAALLPPATLCPPQRELLPGFACTIPSAQCAPQPWFFEAYLSAAQAPDNYQDPSCEAEEAGVAQDGVQLEESTSWCYIFCLLVTCDLSIGERAEGHGVQKGPAAVLMLRQRGANLAGDYAR